MPAQTLISGYKQVESFGPDEDYLDEEEEVSYVTLDLGMVEPTLLPSSSTYRLIVRVISLFTPCVLMWEVTGLRYTNTFLTAFWIDIQGPSRLAPRD
jgi:hypothetical protein